MLLRAKRSKSPFVQSAQEEENPVFALLQATQPKRAAKKETNTFVRASP
jgi:hypothetical protein